MKRIVLFALCMIAHGPGADRVSAVEPISESAVVRVLTVLRAWVAFMEETPSRTDSVSAGSENSVAERIALIESIRAGRVDPLSWLKEHAASLRIPPLLTYSKECSRTASGLAMSPTALFSFGIEASEYGLALISVGGETSPAMSGEELAETDAQKKVSGIVNSMRSFYHEEKYPDFTNDAPLYWSTVSPDSSLRITVIEANVYLAWGCDSIPTGPLLEISLNESPDDPFRRSRAATTEDMVTILGSAGMSEGEFLSLTTALVLARNDSRNPSALEFDADTRPESEEERKLFDEVKRMVEVRKRNVDLYKHYARVLDPLLDLFEREEK